MGVMVVTAGMRMWYAARIIGGVYGNCVAAVSFL